MGTEQRLIKHGICQYLDIIIFSAEVGISKHNLEIFKMALHKSGGIPADTYMIGDRLDNDIELASKIGMHTIWVK